MDQVDKTHCHEDEELRVLGERHAGIVVKDEKVLLIHRLRNGYEYWVFPGGHRRKGEKGEETVLREVKEETAIVAKNPQLAFKNFDSEMSQHDFYYLCQWQSGEMPSLIGEEAFRHSPNDFYEPVWIEVAQAKSLNILPKSAKDWLGKNL
jgi:8-oxo-dGTP pyrophosphatase MutT (NUDIX family)